MLQKRVSEIALINVDRIPTDRAGFGSTVHVSEKNGEKLVFQLVMPEDADAAKGLISTTSPYRPCVSEQGTGRFREGGHAGRDARVRNRHAADHSRRSHGMTERGRAPFADPYSPQRRTALILTGTGTAGAYHAGVLRALHEAGVKLDIVAGRGIGSVGALFAAVDGTQRLWDEKGFWRAPAVRRLYPWRPVLRLIVGALVRRGRARRRAARRDGAGLVVFPIDFVLKMLGASAASGLVRGYLRPCRDSVRADGAADVAAASGVDRVGARGDHGGGRRLD